MVRGINDSQLRGRALDKQIELVGEAVKRARATWVGAMIIIFVIATSIFNATMSWNDEQIRRRAKLAGVVSKDLGGMWADIKAVPAFKAALVEGAGELGYLKYLLPPEGSDAQLTDEQKRGALEPLRRAVALDLERYKQRGLQLDTVVIPIINVPIAASDIGIVGGLAISIVGFWLLASLRRENHALSEFIRQPENGGNYCTEFSGYKPEESIYAYRSIAHVMVFSVSAKESILNYATTGSFLAPPTIFLINHMFSVIMLFRRGLGDYLHPHFILELVMAVIVTLIWSKALSYQVRTLNALQAWAGLVEVWETRSSTQENVVTLNAA